MRSMQARQPPDPASVLRFHVATPLPARIVLEGDLTGGVAGCFGEPTPASAVSSPLTRVAGELDREGMRKEEFRRTTFPKDFKRDFLGVEPGVDAGEDMVKGIERKEKKKSDKTR